MRNTRLAATAAMVIAITGCGATSDTTADTANPRSASGPTSSGTADSQRTQGDPGDDPFDLTAGDWPTDLTGADALYAKMPAEFQTWPVKHPRYFGSSTGVTYGPASNGASAWSMEADKTVPDAQAALAMMFGMTMACDKTTYLGTAEPERGGLMPGFGSGDDIEPWWFSCQVTGAEGSPNYRAFAVGWTSGDLGWLVVAPDEDSSRDLLDVMITRTK